MLRRETNLQVAGALSINLGNIILSHVAGQSALLPLATAGCWVVSQLSEHDGTRLGALADSVLQSHPAYRPLGPKLAFGLLREMEKP